MLPYMTVEIVEYLDRNGRSPFGIWFDRLPAAAAAKVVVAVDRIGRGLLGDVKSVGHGVSERRIDFGPGYRIYFASIKEGSVIQIAVLLGGGTKKRQNKDVETAQDRWKDCKARRRKGEKLWH
ncbi:MAG: type II toxin-antitoxin system RelE/ParE family toxin [Gammaproteobacteria bacterium]|nr:type II toxin-antitoxin system RelE/ParE family toxin [Gammaproteobacteria bacterium]